MFKVAICDDYIDICIELKKIILDFGEKEGHEFEIDVFDSAQELMDNISLKNEYDILFLDIEIGEDRGNEIGAYIRNKLDDCNAGIVYISSFRQYAMSLFKSRPIDFLIKPLNENDIKNVLDYFIKVKTVKDDFFKFEVGKNIIKIAKSDILFFESDRKKIKVYTSSKYHEYTGKLDDVKLKMPFVRVHQSYIVNMNHVIKYSYDCLIMENDFRVSISRTYRKIIKDLYREKL